MQRTFMLFSLAVLIGLAFVTTSFTRSITDMSKTTKYAQAQSQRGSDMPEQEGPGSRSVTPSQPATPGSDMQRQGDMSRSSMQGSDIFATLKQEHQQVGQMLSRLQNVTDPTQRNEMVSQLNIALYPHMKAEEKTLYDAMKDNSNTKDMAKQARKEHDQIGKALKDVNKSINENTFNANVSKLNQLVSAHVQREEGQIFAAARNIDQAKLSEISTNYEQERQKVAQDTEKKQYEDRRDASGTGRGGRGPGSTTGVTGGSGNGSDSGSRGNKY